MDIQKFVLDYNIVGIALGTIVGFGLTNWTKELRQSVILPMFVKRFNLDENYGTMVSATLEVIILIVLLFLMYQYIVRPAVSDALEEKEKEAEKEKEWREKLIDNINQIEDKVKRINNSNENINDGIRDLTKTQKRMERQQGPVPLRASNAL